MLLILTGETTKSHAFSALTNTVCQPQGEGGGGGTSAGGKKQNPKNSLWL